MPNAVIRSLIGVTTMAMAAMTVSSVHAQSVDPRVYSALTWRNLGPFRAGRVAAVSGAIGKPGTFYIGLPAGGVWKTTSAGETWYPIFDSVKEVSSVGAIEVAPSDPNVIYVGTGDIIVSSISEGNGVYKSTDAGRTWRHLGLDDTKQIPTMLVDPNDPNIVLIGAQGDIHAKSKSRGVFRSTDGGATWTQTLFIDDSTGLQKLARAFDVPSVLFATSIAHYTRGGPPAGATSTQLFKSTDGGVTWKEIVGNGLPRLTGKVSVAVAMHTNAQRVFVIGDSGLFRSDDGGATWRQMAADDQRIRNGQGGYNCGVYVDPQNPDIVYTVSTSSYKSTDGGNTFTGFKGAPGGDDPQQLWFDPTDGQRILAGYDQGAIVTLDGGETWSSWYNQSTAQIYHLSVDNSFPYWVYGTQQDAGAIRTRSRGNLGAITPLDWSPVPAWEWGTIVPDPLDVNTVYASGSGIVKITYPSEQRINVSPAVDPSRGLQTTNSQPIVFAPWNKRMLLAAFQSVWSSTDAGAHWTAISPDLGIRPGGPPVAPGAPRPTGPFAGLIESMRASTVGTGIIWVGTNNGLIKVTRNGGKTWEDASVADPSNGEILAVEPSHFDAGTAYAAIGLQRGGDYAPYLFRTRDFGKSWTKITNGLPEHQPSGSFMRVVRNDTKRKGLLFAGSESGIYVSFDDGDHWQTLMQNLPNTSYRDIAIAGNDLVVATYGRGFWVLDDYSALREANPSIANEAAHLFKPGDAYRVRRNVGWDTPFPPEVPHALNPPDGVIIDYWLARAPTRDITLDVLDASGAFVRHMSSAPMAAVPEAARPPHPNFWVAPPKSLPKNAGGNRTNWDLRYDPPQALSHSFQINANPGLTPPSPEGSLVTPGSYTLKLTVDGKSYSQTVTVKPDPRSAATLADIAAQNALQRKISQAIDASFEGNRAATSLRDAVRSATKGGSPELANEGDSIAARLDILAGAQGGRGRGRGGQGGPPNFAALNRTLVSQLEAQENGDLAPTTSARAAWATACQDLSNAITMWQRLVSDASALNSKLRAASRGTLEVPSAALKSPTC